LVDCIYDDHEAFIDGVVQRCEEDIQGLIKIHSDSSGAVNVFWSSIDKDPSPLVRLYGELLKVKNPAFKEEQEVRLVFSVPKSQVKTRVSNGLIVPYWEYAFLDKDEEHLWCVAPEVWFGPKCDKRNMQALRAFGQFGWDTGSVHHYDCGYI
jgi:hypothetical protein